MAKEFVVVQHATGGTGTLAVSEFTGAADELKAATSCNPFDTEGASEMGRCVRRHDIHPMGPP